MMNPIYKRERKSGSRNVRFPAVLTAFNAVIAAAALGAMWLTIRRVVETGELRYSVFLTLFSRLAWVEFAAAAVMMPAVTSGCITGERERKTLELVLTTRMTAAEIILGKLLWALSSVVVLLLTGTPVFAAVLLFGGVRPRNLLLLYLLILLTACFTGSIGMFFSAVSRRTPVAAASSYALLAVLGVLPVCVFDKAVQLVTGQGSALSKSLLSAVIPERILLSPALLPAGCVILGAMSAAFLLASAVKISPLLHKHRHLGSFSFL
ncbi:MAG: ABC transporter permease [Stomatobaculum sp.]|nr:ABC transporter permease [Stomatobaculum sp.]